MKNLSFLIVLIFLSFACNDKTDDSTPEDKLVQQIIGNWMDEDSYLEYKRLNESLTINEFDGIQYHINEDGSYSVENELEFGVPNGEGYWLFHEDFEILEFHPGDEVNYDTSHYFYWKDFEFDGNNMTCNFYNTDKLITVVGNIESNRIPRHFRK